MTPLRDSAVSRLRELAASPQFVTDRYEPIEEIGRGGMGTVYRARDRELGRDVAIKISHGTVDAPIERRLRSEAGILAQLEHPGIVPIHDAGRLADGRLFYVMKWVKGRTLREWLATHPTQAELLRIFERLCEPVAFAHDAGVIHRDLKPENVMIGAFGEVLVMDWGVAKQQASPAGSPDATRDPAAPATASGDVIGTPGFMPPEQAQGHADRVDTRADVYSLGAIFYLFLTGEEPDPNGSVAIRSRRGIARPLRAICARAMEPEPAARYGTVTALADDVARYRAGEAIQAHRESMLERGVRLARTYRTAILLVLGYIVMRTAVALLAGW